MMIRITFEDESTVEANSKEFQNPVAVVSDSRRAILHAISQFESVDAAVSVQFDPKLVGGIVQVENMDWR